MDTGRVYIMNKKKADSMPNEYLDILKTKMRDSIVTKVLPGYKQGDEEAAEMAKKFGAQVIDVDVTTFREGVKAVYEQFKPALGMEALEIIRSTP
jgi:TRAP-type C4-dicarboxylate transport system substrate-binding protein